MIENRYKMTATNTETDNQFLIFFGTIKHLKAKGQIKIIKSYQPIIGSPEFWDFEFIFQKNCPPIYKRIIRLAGVGMEMNGHAHVFDDGYDSEVE